MKVQSVPAETAQDYLYQLLAMTSSEAKRQWRAAIKAAWNNCCAYCNTPPIDDRSLTIDHVKPKSKGGEDRTSNCIPACKTCNHSKGSTDWVAWFRMQPSHSLEAELKIKHWLQTGEVREYPPDTDNWKA
jgi:hypothetical protein